MSFIFKKQEHYFRVLSFLIFVFFVQSKVEAFQIDSLSVYSTSMQKNVPVLLVKPELIKKQSVPVLYLLHGYSGNEKTWLNIEPDLGVLADDYGMAFVCPSGENSWYWDSPAIETSKFETFISKELYPYISNLLQIEGKREKVAITGLSMGGHGAFWIAGKHPELFGAIGSMSGGLDLRPFPKNWNLIAHLGEIESNSALWNDYTVASHIDRFADNKYAIIFDCGVEDFFYQVNVDMHNAFIEKKIPHDFISRPGVHNAAYWKNAIKYQLLFFYDFFNR